MYSELMREHRMAQSMENAEKFKYLSDQMDRITSNDWRDLKEKRTDQISVVMTTFNSHGVKVVSSEDSNEKAEGHELVNEGNDAQYKVHIVNSFI